MPLPLSVRSIPHQISPPVLARLESTPLVPLLVGLSQFVSTGVARSRRVADGMALRGSRRLQAVQAAAPRLRESIEHLLADGAPSRLRQTAEEMALIRALIEFCLGWVLYLLEQTVRSQSADSAAKPRWAMPLGASLHWGDARRHSFLKCPTPA